jgi:hypothetical protein
MNNHASSAKLDIWVESLTCQLELDKPMELLQSNWRGNIPKYLETKNEVLKSSGGLKLIYFDT